MLVLTDSEARLVNQPMSRKDVVLTLLRAAIIDGRLKGGQRLDQNEIAASFNVSRMPVREALKQLELEGLVVVYPYRGVEVAGLDVDEVPQLFAIRGALERLAVGRATEALDASDFAALRDILFEMDNLVGLEGAAEQWSDLNRRFHERINGACGWPRLLDAIATYRDKVDRYVRLYFSMRGRVQSQKDHWGLLRALEQRDRATAEDMIEAHSNATAKLLLDAIEAGNTATANEVRSA
jgi:DNA-binding GntR family transcriptional regulator